MNTPPINTRRLRGAFLAANTNKLVTPNKRDPITMKSVSSQLTSVVNSIAIKGISNIATVASAIQNEDAIEDAILRHQIINFLLHLSSPSATYSIRFAINAE